MKKVILSVLVLVVVAIVGFWWVADSSKTGLPIATADSATVRTTLSGEVIGYREENGVHGWLGIPFAQAPVGKQRWKAPLSPEPWEGVYEALKTGSPCTQIGGPLGNVPKKMYDKPIGSEDCLYLNVWAPEYAPGNLPQGTERLPVMFWIHGGGNSIGHGGSYNARVLASTYHLIIVTINYRLGPFGWFTHPALRADSESAEEASGNFGTLDIIQALTWVQDNISNFGGDPDRVTVFGESAGARNTLTMMLSPKASGLFHRAIVQSGSDRTTAVERGENYLDDPVSGHRNSSREIVNQLLIADKKASHRQEAKTYQNAMSDQDITEYLYGKNNYELLGVYQDSAAGMLNFPQVFRDGVVLPADKAPHLFQSTETYNAVPVILGTNRDEYKLFMALNPDYVTTYFKVIPVIKDEAEYNLIAGYMSDAWKISGVDEIAERLSRTQGSTVYAYRFDWDEEPSRLGIDISRLLGAAHGFEIPFVFNDPDVGFSSQYTDYEGNLAGRKALSSTISSYWAEFAYSGSPGEGRNDYQAGWKPWSSSSPDSERLMVFDSPGDRGVRMSSETVTFTELKRRLLAETGFSNQKSHCSVYVNLFGVEDGFFGSRSLWNDAEYDNLGKEGCRDYPPAMFLR